MDRFTAEDIESRRRNADEKVRDDALGIQPWTTKKPHSQRRPIDYNEKHEHEMKIRMLMKRNARDIRESVHYPKRYRASAMEEAKQRTMDQLRGKSPMPEGFIEHYEWKRNH